MTRSARSNGFRREHRLTHKRQFDHVLSNTTVHLRSGPFRVFATCNDLGSARLGLIVGKRQLKRAVDRNRVKRAVRETFRINRSQLPALDIIVQLTQVPAALSLNAQTTTMWPQLVVQYGKENDLRRP